MKLLVLYRLQSWNPQRKAIEDHIRCFSRYLQNAKVYECNVLLGVPFYLRGIDFDGIILHSTVMDRDVRLPNWFKHLSRQLRPLSDMQGVKMALPQDEWENTETLWQLFRQTGVDELFTCASPDNYRVLYPDKASKIQFLHTTYPGFVDEAFVASAERLAREVRERDIDVGYRARHMGFLCGRLGLLKHELAERFQSHQGRRGLIMDISNKSQDVFYGDDWTRFLLRCRTVLGCPGGSSLFDLDGSIRQRVESYLKKHPSAHYEEVEAACFKGQEGKFSLSAISPRHFECAITKTCQVLVEGSYSGQEILKPGVHYIELKRDFSNVDEVLEQVSDKRHCEAIAERSYSDLVGSGKYTYRKFAEEVYEHVRQRRPQLAPSQPIREAIGGWLLRRREANKSKQRLLWRLWYLWHISLPKRLKYG